MATARDDLKTEFLSQIPDISNSLDANPEQLRNTLKYYDLASSPRERTQRLLDQIVK